MRFGFLALFAAACGLDHFDADGDGFPDCDRAGDRCDLENGQVDPSLADCNDTDPDIHPAAEETCDGIDNDCDGSIDGHDEDNILDCDEDGFPNIAESPGDPDDCDDNDANASPGNVEICDGIDNDCDGFTDGEGCPADRSPVLIAPTGDPGCQCSDAGLGRPVQLPILLLAFLRRRNTARSQP